MWFMYPVQCTMYILQRTHFMYIAYMRNKPFIYILVTFTLAGPTHLARNSKIMNGQTKNVCKCCE